VFAGGCALEAAEEVADADLDSLQSLVEKSLVRFTNERYWMLETIREYAVARLEESDDAERIRGNHAEHILELAEQADIGYFGREQGLWFDRLGAEQDNIRAALAWAAEQPTETAVRLCGLLGFFWFVRGQWREAQAWCDRAAARPRAAPLDVSARAMEVQGLFLALLGDPEAGIALADRAVETWRALGDPRRLGQSLVIRQMVAPTVEETEAACREAIAVARSCGDEAVLGISLTNSADLALKRGEFDAARAFAQESAEVLARSGDDFNRSGALANGASAALMQGDVDAAASGYADALELAQRLQAVEVVAWAISGLAAVAVRRGDPDRAVQLTGAADALLTAHGIPELGDFEDKLRDETIASAGAALGDHAVAEQLERGLALTADEAVELALAD
jgi:tetratricopeptide (TPR) repeat protein